MLDIFQKSEEYQSKFFEKACSYYDWGVSHILRQFPQFIPDKKLNYKVFEGSFAEMEYRVGVEFISFTVEELKDIALADAQSGNTCTPPPPAKPTFFDYLINCGLRVKQLRRIHQTILLLI